MKMMSDRNDLLPLVSVIIPTYNRPEYLRLTVESVLEQTYPNVEVIVVDDASTDHTPDVMAAYGDRVRYLREPVNTGGEQVILTGLAAARGKYINFLDHDDLMYPQKIARQVERLEADERLSMAHCGYHHIDENGQLLETITTLPEGYVLDELLRGDFMWSGAPLIRRTCIDQSEIATSLFWCSADWARVLAVGLMGRPVACVQEPLGAYRILPHSDISNVKGLEEWVIPLLEMVFAHPKFPASSLGLRDEAFARMRFFLSCRYYTSHQWEDAERNLEAALTGYPSVFQNRDALVERLCEDALSIRVQNPEQFISGLLEHLPPGGAFILEEGHRIYSRIHFGLALRSLVRGEKEDAQAHMQAAYAQEPALFDHRPSYTALIVHYCLLLPVEKKLEFIDQVLAIWPRGMSADDERYIRGWFYTSWTIHEYSLEHAPAQIFNKGVRALLHSPGAIKNGQYRSVMLATARHLLMGRN